LMSLHHYANPSLSFYNLPPHRDLHSFPTRRSSDLRLDGFANLHNPRTGLLTYQSPGVTEHSLNPRIPLDYDPRLLGYLTYDPAKDRKSTRLNSSHGSISYAVFCLKKKKERAKYES